MMKRAHIKGIRDIATTIHRPRRNGETSVGGAGLGSMSINDSCKKAAVSDPRTWVFSTKPKFIRHRKPVEKSLLVEKVEEPSVDVFDKVKQVVVLADMPGADKDTINCKVKDDILVISARAIDSDGEKTFEKEILLPFMASPDSMQISFENPLLEIKLAKKENGRKLANAGKKRR